MICVQGRLVEDRQAELAEALPWITGCIRRVPSRIHDHFFHRRRHTAARYLLAQSHGHISEANWKRGLQLILAALEV